MMEKAQILTRPPFNNDSLFQSIINDDHSHIDWAEKLDLMMKKQHTVITLSNLASAVTNSS